MIVCKWLTENNISRFCRAPLSNCVHIRQHWSPCAHFLGNCDQLSPMTIVGSCTMGLRARRITLVSRVELGGPSYTKDPSHFKTRSVPIPARRASEGERWTTTLVSRLGDSPGFDSGNPRTVAIVKTAYETFFVSFAVVL